MIAKSILICSPLNLVVYLDPYCAPITPPISKKIASIKSTVKLNVAWRIETFKVTKTIWNNEVPIAVTVDIPNKYIIAGTITNPPPTPINEAKKPTKIPTLTGNKIDI